MVDQFKVVCRSAPRICRMRRQIRYVAWHMEDDVARERYAESSIEDYTERTEQTVTAWKSMNGQQIGDPAKLASALVQLAAQDEQPLRFAAGADAVATFENRAKQLLDQADAYHDLSSSLAYDET